MKFLKTGIGVSLIITFALLGLAAITHAQSPQATLSQYISDLQKNPNDNALREKIIKHVQGMKAKPAIPREAERFMNRGSAAVKSAKDANDFKDAVAEFEKATLAAPWLANAYYNLGIAQDKAGQYASAIKSLKLYLVAAPNAPDAKKVKTLIDELEYRQEKAAKGSSPEVVAAKKEKEQEEFLRRINGARYVYRWHNAGADEDGYGTLDVLNDTITVGGATTRSDDRSVKVGVWEANGNTYKIYGRTLRGFFFGNASPQMTGVITDDGSTITTIFKDPNGAERVTVYKRER